MNNMYEVAAEVRRKILRHGPGIPAAKRLLNRGGTGIENGQGKGSELKITIPWLLKKQSGKAGV